MRTALGVFTAMVAVAVVLAAPSKSLTAPAAGMSPGERAPFTVKSGPPSTIEAVGGSPQSAVIRTVFPLKLKALVRDVLGNPVAGATVNYGSPSSGPGADFNGGRTTAVSDTDGVATSATVSANTVSGSYNVTASTTGIAATALFSLRNDPGGAASLVAVSGTPQTAMVGKDFGGRLTVTAKDAGGNPVGDVLIRFRSPSAGPGALFGGGPSDSSRTDPTGIATSRIPTANSTAGKYDVVAAADGGASATFTLTNDPGLLTRMVVQSPQGDPIDTQQVGRQFTVQILAVDQFANLVTTFAGKAVIQSDGILSIGDGETGPFNQGVLTSAAIAFKRAGAFVLVVTRSGGMEGGTSNRFVVANPRPAFTSITPSSFHPGDTATVTIDGSGFLDGVTVPGIQGGFAFSTVTVLNATRISAVIRVDPEAVAGPRDLTILNPPPGGGTALAGRAVQITGNPIPAVTSVTPSIGYQGERLTLGLRGSGFIPQVTNAVFSGTGIHVDSVFVDSTSSARILISIQPDAVIGVRDLVLTNPSPGGGSYTMSLALSVYPTVAALPVPVSPTDNAENQPARVMVQWQGVSGVGLYHLQVTRNGDFISRLVVDDSTVAGASMTVGPLDGAVQYSWRVRAVLGMGTGPWSAVRQFTVTPASARTLAVSATIPFPSYGSQSEYASSDYRLVGLPGIGTSLLSVIMGGVAGVDWQAYWDNGASDSNFVRYDGDPVFVPGSGRGYWMLKRGPWVVLTSVDAMHVDSASQSVFIPLHPGWNIVTDPYNWRLSAEKVGTANGISEPFYGYRGGFYKADTMEACQGYYYFNDPQHPIAQMRVPVDATPSAAGKRAALARTTAPASGWTIGIKVDSKGASEDVLRLGVDPEARAGRDALDVHKPKSPSPALSVRFLRPEWDLAYPEFASDIRPVFADSALWQLSVETSTPLTLTFGGLEALPHDFAVVLVDPVHRASADLRQDPHYRFDPAIARSNLLLAVGQRELVERVTGGVVPGAFALGQNFPNPFNPSTIIPVDVPARASVTLKLFDALGREIQTLHQGELEPGRHFFTWKGVDAQGQPVSTGVYFCRLQDQQGKSLVRKLVLVR